MVLHNLDTTVRATPSPSTRRGKRITCNARRGMLRLPLALPTSSPMRLTTKQFGNDIFKQGKDSGVRRLMQCVPVGILVWLGTGPRSALGEEVKEKPVLEQILDLLKQRGQIDEKQYNALQEKAKKEQASAFQAGIANGRPFFKSTYG